MPESGGHIELERSVASIVVGVRHRTEVGDLGPLMKSIQASGLLQPVTITPEGVLVCGRRRLEAVKRLGWRTLKVWVRSGISGELARLLAQRDENELRKPLTPLEQAALYQELRRLLAEDAARRQEASRFGTTQVPGEENGGGDSPPPSRPGKTRDQAAHLVTGSASYHRLEHVNELRRIAADQHVPAGVRELAHTELAAIEAGASVHPAYTKVKAALEPGTGEATRRKTTEELELLATEALARVQQQRRAGGGRSRSAPQSNEPTRRSLRAFILTWTDLDGWSSHYDAEEVGVKLGEKEWETFERVLRETTAFADVARAARQRVREPVSA